MIGWPGLHQVPSTDSWNQWTEVHPSSNCDLDCDRPCCWLTLTPKSRLSLCLVSSTIQSWSLTCSDTRTSSNACGNPPTRPYQDGSALFEVSQPCPASVVADQPEPGEEHEHAEWWITKHARRLPGSPEIGPLRKTSTGGNRDIGLPPPPSPRSGGCPASSWPMPHANRQSLGPTHKVPGRESGWPIPRLRSPERSGETIGHTHAMCRAPRRLDTTRTSTTAEPIWGPPNLASSCGSDPEPSIWRFVHEHRLVP